MSKYTEVPLLLLAIPLADCESRMSLLTVDKVESLAAKFNLSN